MGHTSRQRLCQREYLSKSADPWVLSECLHNEWDGKRCECIYFFTFTYRIKVMMPSSCTEKSLCSCVYGHKYVMYVCSFLSIHFLNGLWEFTATNQVLGNVMSLHSNRSSAHTHLDWNVNWNVSTSTERHDFGLWQNTITCKGNPHKLMEKMPTQRPG